MALIKCPECHKDISDKANKCPHCGYSSTKNARNFQKSNLLNFKWDNKYFFILIILLGGYLLLFNSKNVNNNQPVTNPSTELKPNANGNFEFNQHGKYFEFPTNYKVFINKEGTIEISQYMDDNGALIPYITIEKYQGYSKPEDLLNELTQAIFKEYPDATITINLLSGYLGNKYTYGIQYAYTSKNHLVIDNRYAFLINTNIYLVTTKEENINTTEINNTTRLIIESLKEVN